MSTHKQPEVLTFGCRLNSFESSVMKSHLKEAAATHQDFDNVVLVNTCAVTKEAERQAKQAIRKLHRENPSRKIVVTGCASEINPVAYQSIAGVVRVIGNQEKLQRGTYQTALLDSNIDWEQAPLNEVASHLVSGVTLSGSENKARAYLQVQNGCDHRCTFCIIPYGRGPSRSVPVGIVIDNARKMVENGFHELVLTGVDLTDYGKDLPGTPRLGELVKRLLALVPDLKRLRLSSVDVAEIDADLLRAIAQDERLMPHLHLSLQAGSNIILKRMKRRHSREDALKFCAHVRNLRPDVVFGADIIAGFPTETDVEFKETADIVDEAGLTYLHVFPYSEREGTPAAKIPVSKQVPKAVRKARAAFLRKKGEEQMQKFFASEVGKTRTIIFEKDNVGRSEHYAPVMVEGSFVPGSYKKTVISGYQESGLLGKVIN